MPSIHSSNLIILDFCDTLVEIENGRAKWRTDAQKFLERLDDKARVIASEADGPYISEFLAPYPPYFLSIYDVSHSIEEKGTRYKNLGHICKDIGVRPELALMVGHSSIDERSAKRFGIDYIKVPSPENRDFSILSLLKQ